MDSSCGLLVSSATLTMMSRLVGPNAEVRPKACRHRCRDNRNHHQEEGAKQREAVADFTQILARGPSGADARNEATVLLKVLADLDRVEGDRGVEVRERHNEERVR